MGQVKSTFTSSYSHNEPIIGIYGLPEKDMLNKSWIPASYVKWIEAAGARVVPLAYDLSEEEGKKMIQALNGLLFIGGSGPLTPNARTLFALALDSNKKGDFFPVWGICLGFEWILKMMGKIKPESGFDSINLPLPLQFTKYNSRIFYHASSFIKKILTTENVTYNHHRFGFTPQKFSQNHSLKENFTIVSTNQDRAGKCFISMYEGKIFPIHGITMDLDKKLF